MVVGIGIVEIYVGESRSLKEKRAVMRRIIGRTESAFSLSIAEVGRLDNWKQGTIGFAVVGNDRRYINSKADKIIDFIERLNVADVLRSEIELITIANHAGE